jgi:hypothetical protein
VKDRGATGAGVKERGAIGAGPGVNERGATGAGLGEKGRGATGVGLGEKGRGAGVNGAGVPENVREGACDGEMGRGTSVGRAPSDVGGRTGRDENDGVVGRENADDCMAPACAPESGRACIGRDAIVDWANATARVSCTAREAGMASAGTWASAIVGPRAAEATR